MKFRLVFVMDLLDGQVVHALRGQRDQYQPINRFSSLVHSPDPLQIIQELKPRELYIADLNRLTGRGDNRIVVKALRRQAAHIMLDYGLHELTELQEAGTAGLADTFVLGTETASLEFIAAATCSEIPVSVSIDIINNKILTHDRQLQATPLDVIKKLNDYPLEEVIILNVDRVGSRSGIDRAFLQAAVAVSDHALLCAGGIRRYEDLDTLREIGIKGALVATAVHDGSIPVSALRTDEPVSTHKNFQTEVLNLLTQVPEGKVTTYGELARALTGSVRAARAVGQAVARNPQPITIPCHRVVRSTGEVGEYGGGVAMKIQLLRAEGVEIAEGKVVDFEHKVFRFEDEQEQLRFLTDRMFGKLTTWLRILGYDTLYAADLAFSSDQEDEDNALAAFAAREDRILLTRDKKLVAFAIRKGARCVLIKADEVLDQLQELLQHHVPIKLEPVPERCSECNARIRKVDIYESALLRHNSYVPQDMIGTWEFWVCDRCGRIYWEGSHWRDIRERLKRLAEQ
jgi:phosphoribosylformimino-5-aminoimidazole carboxamide ribotide isomerase